MSLVSHTAWSGSDLIVSVDGREVDRIASLDIRRVVCVHRDGGETPGDLAYVLIELAEAWVVLPPDSGIAGRVHFERQAFWDAHPCIYWIDESQAALPSRYRAAAWWIRRRAAPPYRRIPRAEAAQLLVDWPLEGPMTWQQRKWRRIESNRPLANLPVLTAGDERPRMRL